jgi:hypothetical protein
MFTIQESYSQSFILFITYEWTNKLERNTNLLGPFRRIHWLGAPILELAPTLNRLWKLFAS